MFRSIEQVMLQKVAECHYMRRDEDCECARVKRESETEASVSLEMETPPPPLSYDKEDNSQICEAEDDDVSEGELEISVKSNEDDGNRVKKFIVSYESKVIKSRDPSPTPSHVSQVSQGEISSFLSR